jgi:putative sigma-54 modulation protein
VFCDLSQGGDSVQVKISTRHGHLSDETQEKITAKVGKLTRFYDRLAAIEVTIDLERRDGPRVDLKVSAKHKHEFVATGRCESLMASIEQVVDKMEQQLRKHKEKIRDRHRSPGHRQQKPSGPSEPGKG